MVDLKDLRAFARIADVGSVSGAARSLKLPKASVSRRLARLEESLGVLVFERSTRGLRLTDAGLLLQRHARRILDDIGEAESAISSMLEHPRGDLRISVPFSFATGGLAPMLPSFLARYPDVRVVLTVDTNGPIDALPDDVDIAVRIGPLPDSNLVARHVASFELWPCASPGYLASYPEVSVPDSLRGHRLISHADHPETWHFRTASGTARDIDVAPGIVVPEPTVLRTMLLGGMGIGLLPDYHAREAVASGALVRLLPDFRGQSVDAHVLYPSRRSLSAKVRVFIDALATQLRAPSCDGMPIGGPTG